jgi:hypothetical protein
MPRSVVVPSGISSEATKSHNAKRPWLLAENLFNTFFTASVFRIEALITSMPSFGAFSGVPFVECPAIPQRSARRAIVPFPAQAR